ncbi:hypothetical protein GR170_08275 [Pseudooceanicola sp. GBMRC 2024]|uniref:Uncharacterized protein n=1 Tax=Pseudooceanicola albus TaxID=2692189 RepID=A0A6L7G2Y8_9RHOB|nr:hypothetical protein [Pseudooceanicola albus]MXN17827.1 hypothetical protein [Pseudooceanicola albus]
MEAPFEATSWNGITGAVYAGYGSSEALWLILCLAMVVVAIFFGWKHEEHAYKATRKKG